MVKETNKIVDSGIYLILAFSALLCLAPILYAVALSFSDKAAANAGLVYFWPINFTLSSYKEVLGDRLFFTSFGVSVQRVVLGGMINFLITVLMAYPLSKSARLFPGRNVQASAPAEPLH